MEPGEHELKEGRPFVEWAPSGGLLARMLADNGIRRREEASYDNARLCPAPKSMREADKNRSDEACFPHVRAAAAIHPITIALGANAFAALRRLGATGGVDASVTSMRGFPLKIQLDGVEKPALASYHPAFVLRSRRWTATLRSDIAKALRHAAGTIDWVAPEIIVNPTLDELDAALARFAPGEVVSVDIETDGTDPLICRIRCVGLASASFGVTVGFRSITGADGWYRDGEKQDAPLRCDPVRGRERISNFFRFVERSKSNEAPRLCGQNINLFDRPCLDRFGMALPPRARVADTILMHRIFEGELPHGLDYMSSRYTDVPKWKPPHDHDSWPSDEELHVYNGLDNVATARIAPLFYRKLADGSFLDLYAIDLAKTEFYEGLHRVGMLVNPVERERHATRLAGTPDERESKQYGGAIGVAERRCRQSLVDSGLSQEKAASINLGSVPQLRDLMYVDLNLDEPSVRTRKDDPESDPSTSKDAIYEILDPNVSARPVSRPVEEFLISLLEWRRVSKLYSTYVSPDALTLDADGRVHSTFAANAVTGRGTSQNPNLTNIPDVKDDPDSLRSMYCAGDGNILVYRDMEQLELKIVTILSGDETWFDAFRRKDRGEKIDVHKMNAAVFYGVRENEVSESMRAFGKCVVGDTRVAVPGVGLVKIEDFGRALPDNDAPIEDARLRTVLSPAGAPVAAARYYFGGVCRTVRVETRTGYVVEGTPEHRVMLASGAWRRLDAIVAGEALLVRNATAGVLPANYVRMKINPWVTKNGTFSKPDALRENRHDAPGLPEFDFDEQWGYLLGALHGDGCVSGTNNVYLCGLPGDGVVDRVEQILANVGLSPRRDVRKTKVGNRLDVVRVHSVAFVEYLRRLGFCGRHSPTPRSKLYEHRALKKLAVPDVVFRSPASVVLSYVAGLFDTDGTVGQDGFSCTSSSAELLRGVKLLLDLFGVSTTLHARPNKRVDKTYYTLAIGRAASRRIPGLLPMACARKLARFEELSKTWGAGGRRDASTDEVVRVSTGEAAVHDLSVPDGEAFLANGLVQHNTFLYRLLYRGGARRALQQMKLLRDPVTGIRPYAHMELKEARVFQKKLLVAHPALERWWKKEEQEFRIARVLYDAINGRPRYFLDAGDDGETDDEVATELVNFRAQSTGRAFIDLAIVELLREFPWGVYGPGLEHDGHDSLMAEVEKCWRKRSLDVMKHAMERSFGGLWFGSEGKSGPDWAHMEKEK